MWGWLLVLASRMRVKRPLRHTTSLILATLILGIVQYLFAGWPSLIRLIVAIILAIFAHIVWLRGIKQQQISQ